jgi:hypothetical protein
VEKINSAVNCGEQDEGIYLRKKNEIKKEGKKEKRQKKQKDYYSRRKKML